MFFVTITKASNVEQDKVKDAEMDLDRKKEKLELFQKKLQQQELFLDDLKNQVNYVSTDGQTQISLNVGGTKFVTTLDTLLRENQTLLRSMFSDTVGKPWGEVFIDRDAKHFALILNYLRNGHVHLQQMTEQELRELRDEAKFYKIETLAKLVNEKLGSNTWLNSWWN